MRKFGGKMKKTRIEKGLTLQKMADDLNTTTATLSRYENGKTQPNIEMINKIADYLNTTVDYLIGRTDKKYPDWYKNLPDKLKKLVDKHGIEFLGAWEKAAEKGVDPRDIEFLIESFENFKPLVDKLIEKENNSKE